MDKMFPEGMVPLTNAPFSFACHEAVPCFTRCCRQVDMILFPYDVLRLRRSVKMRSEEFLRHHTRIVEGDHPYFPALKLGLDEENHCPFLGENGCTVYRDRPSACRTYPLERAVDRNPQPGQPKDFYFLTKHDYCLGHAEDTDITVSQWVRSQQLERFNLMNDLWAELDTLFSSNPWRGEGAGGEKQRLAFMVCYDIDGFREFVQHHDLLRQFRLDKDLRRRVQREDEELLKFGFEWLTLLLTGKSKLLSR